MAQLDLRKQWKHLYAPSAKKVELVEVPAFNFVMIDGPIETGQSPGTSPPFEETLAPLRHGVHPQIHVKQRQKTRPLSGYGDGSSMVGRGRQVRHHHPGQLVLPLMILQPDLITAEIFAEGLAKRRRNPATRFSLFRLAGLEEGLCVQTMHLGPYATETATIARMDVTLSRGEWLYLGHGKHHEIYLGDPRKAAPDKLKTVLRHPVMRISE